jgi:hypothetical protein
VLEVVAKLGQHGFCALQIRCSRLGRDCGGATVQMMYGIWCLSWWLVWVNMGLVYCR